MRLNLHWRRHWKLVTVFAAVLAVLLFALGGIRLAALNSGGGSHPRKGDIAGTVDLFDESLVHTIAVTFDPAEYEAAMAAFSDEGDKDFFQADVVIDGTPVQDVGIRLKGNSTLFGPGPGAPGVPGAQAEPAAGGTVSDEESPEDLPWLISFGEYITGQTYQGHDAVAVRPAGLQGAMTTALNEALSLSLIDLAGEPVEEAAYSAFSVNGSTATLRLVVQEPGDSLAADDFGAAGALYKAQSGGSFTYLGLDPDAYDGSFRQVSGEDQADLAPLIEFIRWVEESTDEQFASGLGERLDAASLARYLALHNLLLDFDDMTGPGQNYYLWWDSSTEQFTVVSWDLNLSWSGDPTRGPFEQGAMAGPGGAAGPQGGGLVPGVGQAPPGQMPGGGAPPGGGPRPGGQTAPGGALPSQSGPPQAGDGPVAAMGGNLLAERFLEVDEFRALYEGAYRDLYDELFAGGAALQTLDTWAATLSGAAGELIDAATLEQEVATLRELITARAGALADNPLVTG